MNILTTLSAKIIAILAATFLVTGCNTVKGLGQDIESVGKAGEEAID